MLRSLFTLVAIVVLTIVIGIPAIVLGLLFPRGEWILRFGKIWARGICAAAGVSVEARGVEAAPHDRPAILISNHQSNADILAILVTMPGPFRVVAKRLLFYVPVFGWCLWLAGMIPIDRTNRARAMLSLDRAAERVRAGDPVLLFPEGTRSPDGRMLPFKKGAFVLALKAGVPIVPVSISGSQAVLPKGGVLMKPGRIVVRFGREISVEGHSLEKKERLMGIVQEAVRAGLEAT